MWGRLAARFHCTIREAQERCDSREFVLWQAIYQREPWGCEAEDVRMALLASYIVNCFVKKGKEISPKDLLPAWGKKRDLAPSPEQLAAKIHGIFGGMAARAKRMHPKGD